MKQAGIFFIALLWLASSCHKEDKLPTDGHENIFRCKINGVEWTPDCISDFFGCSAIDCQYYKENQALNLVATKRFNDNSIDQGFNFSSRPNTSDSTFQIIYLSGEYADWNFVSGCKVFDLDTNKIRRITIYNLDTVNYRISGDFEFTVANKCLDTLYISDGYFNVEYRF